MNASAQALEEEQEQQRLAPLYLAGLRQRFKNLINRLTTGGDMLRQLEGQPDAADLAFLMSYVQAWHWLRNQVPEPWRGPMLSAFKGSARAFLMELLEHSATAEDFVLGYIDYWRSRPEGGLVQQQQLLRLLQSAGSEEALLQRVMTLWQGLGLYPAPDKKIYVEIAREERNRYDEMLGPEDRERLALVDELPDVPGKPAFDKLGMIPHMGCPQTCRHCMFIFRPFVKGKERAGELYRQVDELTESLLFTGGDLTRHMEHFYRAIREMRRIRNFAILLNGDFADSPKAVRELLGEMVRALRARPAGWPKAGVLLQISFDEFHQEVMLDKHGRLKERIPVRKIANIVEQAPKFPAVQLALLHKQNALNFSMDLFQKGVFARLAAELGQRGHRVQVISSAPAERLKAHPLTGERGRVVKDATFVLAKYPDYPILLTSSTIDSYGRAELLEPGEAVQERDYLAEVLERGCSPGQGFDTDLMFWFNGWATLFSAVHVCLGNVYDEGMERVLARQRKDPLCHALADFDTRLLDFYAEINDDLPRLVEQASSPHQLFHKVTEDAAMRLHMTRRLLST